MLNRRQSGLTLIELLIAIVLGSASVLALASVVGFGIGSNGTMLSSSRLTQEMKAIAAYVEGELRRTGYTADTVNIVADPANVNSPFANSVTTSAFPGEAADSCITYAYDRNQNGALDAAPNENFGIRLRNEMIEVRVGGAACDAGGWQDLSDPDMIDITELLFNVSTVTVNGIDSIRIDYQFSAQLADNANLNRSYQSSVLVRSYD